MNTVFLLMAQYNAQVIIPLERVRVDYFSHLTPAQMKIKLETGEIGLPLIQTEGSKKAVIGVHLMDLAGYLDALRANAKSEQSRLMVGSREPPVEQRVRDEPCEAIDRRESLSDLIRLPEVRKLTGFGTSTIYKKVNSGDFPPQVKLGGRAVAWIRGEVLEWRQKKIEASRLAVR